MTAFVSPLLQTLSVRSRKRNNKYDRREDNFLDFFIIAIASEIDPADFGGISMIGDGINHGVPNHKELQTSISWLIKKGLVLKAFE